MLSQQFIPSPDCLNFNHPPGLKSLKLHPKICLCSRGISITLGLQSTLTVSLNTLTCQAFVIFQN